MNTKTKTSLLKKIEDAKLVGRGGAGFPTHIKWNFVEKAKGTKKYVICNASEGEIGLFKDIYILDHFTEDVFEGMRLAMDFLGTKHAWFNMNANYYRNLQNKLEEQIAKYKKMGYDFRIFQEKPSYIGGEETALLNAIEGKRAKPRLKPPFPAEKGLFGKPTLVHNVETLYNICQVNRGDFKDNRFYCLLGPVCYPGVYELPAEMTLHEVMKNTNNIPEFDYFVQIGGSASGIVYNSEQLKTEKMSGGGSIEVYPADTPPKEMLIKWFEFYARESCGKCTPCREGTYQLHKLIQNCRQIPWKQITEILDLLEDASFCALGKSVPTAVRTYCENVLGKKI